LKLVFLGPPGAGKGTQAARMAQVFGLEHASTGNIFRRAVAQDSELGRQVRSYLDAGKLVPDKLTSRVVKELILDRSERYILDGYPRTVPQARALDRMLEDRGQRLDAALYFQLDEEAAIARLAGRLVCERCGENYHRLFMPPRQAGLCDQCGGPLVSRSDSSRQVVLERLAEYANKTRPLVSYYEQRGLLRRIDASPDPAMVERRTRALLAELEGRR